MLPKHLLLTICLCALPAQASLAQTAPKPMHQQQAGQPSAAIDFGDDSGMYPNDGECDDPRFTGAGMAPSGVSTENSMKDATDCQALAEAGRIRPVRTKEESDVAECATIDFGNDTSEWANDDECDDPRFTGGSVDEILLPEDEMHDAADCRSLCESGDIWLR